MNEKYNIVIEFINGEILKLEAIQNFFEYKGNNRIEFNCPKIDENDVIIYWYHYVISQDKIMYYYFYDNNKNYTEKEDN